MKRVIVVGSGGHAKVVIDILEEMKDIEIVGVTSVSIDKNSTFFGYPVLGDDNSLRNYDKNDYFCAMGLGGYRDNQLREKVYNYIKSMGFRILNVIHHSAIISKTVKFGDGIVIYPGAVLNTYVQIGNNSIIASGATIDHEAIVGKNVLIGTNVTVGGYSTIKDNVVLGLGSKIIPGVIIGKNSLVGAGAVVVNNISDYSTVFGIPAKQKL